MRNKQIKMEKIFTEKEELKTMQSNRTETNFNKNLYLMRNFQYKNRKNYSKKINTKNMTNITKFFSRDRILLETSNSTKNIIKLGNKKKQKEDYVEKERIILQLILTKNEMDKIDNDMKDYKNFYNKLKETNMTFKTIIEKILKIKEPENNEESSEFEIINILNKKDTKLNAFKKQIINYEKIIEKQEKKLTEVKKEKKTNDFYEKNNLIDDKNKELEDLVSKNKKLQMKKHGKDEDINYYFNEINDLKVSSVKMQESIKSLEKNMNNIEKEIYNLQNEKYQIVKKFGSLVENSLILETNTGQKKEELKSLTDEYERIKDIKGEKDKDETELLNIQNKIDAIKRIIDKNNNKMKMINYDNEQIENDLYIIQAETDRLNEKYKSKQKVNSSLKNLDKEKNSVKNKSKIDDIKNEDKENIFITIPEKSIKKTENNLNKDIKELENELESKKKQNNEQKKELEEIKNKFNVLKNKISQTKP
jgi:chromosome segregation ATPase